MKVRPPLALILAMVFVLLGVFGTTSAHGDLLVTDRSSQGSVERFDGPCLRLSGAALTSPRGIAVGPDGNIYVCAQSGILRFDGRTCAFIDVFVSGGTGGLAFPEGIAFGPDGNLYVGIPARIASNKVLCFSGCTPNTFIREVATGLSGLYGPQGLAFGPDGNLYVSNEFHACCPRQLSQVLCFNPQGTDVLVGSPIRDDGLLNATGIAFGPHDGCLYVSDSDSTGGSIRRYCHDGTNWQFVGAFVPAEDPNLMTPRGLAFGPDETGDGVPELYVVDETCRLFCDFSFVLRFNGMTGAFLSTYRQFNQFSHPYYLAFYEDPRRIRGRVVFEDGSTPVVGAQVIARGRTSGLRAATASVDANGNYAFTDPLPPGTFSNAEYDIAAVYPLPDGFRRFPQVRYALQPYDVDPAADVVVLPSGEVSRSRLDFTYAWPVLLLHGMCLPIVTCDNGSLQLTAMHAYLAGYDPATRRPARLPRRGFIPLVPDMGHGTYEEFYETLRLQLPSVRLLFPSTTRFNVVAYSQGGLVARLVLDRLPGFRSLLRKVVQIATPNQGTCVGNYSGACDSCARVAQALTPEALENFNNDHPSSHGLPFFLVAGTDCHRFGSINTCLTSCSNNNDSIVLVDSVFWLRDSSELTYNVQASASISADHLTVDEQLETLEQVAAWLLVP